MILTCISNDYGYEKVFERQLEALARKGDVFVGLSTSGGSRNVVAAMSLARAYKMPVIALTGPRRSQMGDLADVVIQVPGASTAHVQEGHLCIYHALCQAIEASLFDGGKP